MWTPLILLVSPASASPDRVAQVFEIGTKVGAIAVSEDGRWVAALEKGSDQVRVLDTLSWDTESWDSAPCDGLSGVAGVEMSDGAQRFYVGCADGLVSWLEVDDDGVEVAGESITVGTGNLLGLVAGDGMVWAVESSDLGPVVHLIDPETDGVDETGSFPVSLTQSGYEDILWTGFDVLIAHGGDSVSQVDGDDGTLSVPDTNFTGADCVEGAIGTGPSALFACGSAGVLRYLTSTYEWALALDDTNGLSAPTAIAVDEYDEEDPFVVVADDGQALVFAYDASDGYPSNSADAEIDLGSTELVRLVSTRGYTVGGTESGELWVLTGRPWVEITSVSAESVVNGDIVTLELTADRGGDWELVFGEEGDVTLDSGSVAGGETATASFEVSSQTADWVEGANLVRVVLTDEDGIEGGDGVLLTVDNPPDRVSLSEDDVQYGEELVELSWEGVDDEDLASYELFLSITAFSRGDWPSGGPAFDGQDDLSRMDGYDADLGGFLFTDVTPGEEISVTLSPLTNGTTYYLAVRAVDEGGQEGPMSTVVSVTPQETLSLAERTGDEGGFCGTSGPVSGLGALAAGLFALSRRPARRRALPVMAGLALALPLTAQAQETKEPRPSSNLQLRTGPMWFDEDNKIYDQFEAPHLVSWLEGGPSLWGIAELNLGIGLYTRSGYLLGEDGSLAEAQPDRLFALPVSVSGTLRLDIFREQPIVPIATLGGDYWLWRERWTSGSETDGVGGGKGGWHYGFGAQLLLDPLDREQASLIEARNGVRDSYLIGEYRVQTVDGSGGISFSASSVTLGLKLNY